MSSSFYRLCFCSLLSVRPHPVTRRSEWTRHLRTLEQDRLDELLEQSSSESSAHSLLRDASSSESQSQPLHEIGSSELSGEDMSLHQARDSSPERSTNPQDSSSQSGSSISGLRIAREPSGDSSSEYELPEYELPVTNQALRGLREPSSDNESATCLRPNESSSEHITPDSADAHDNEEIDVGGQSMLYIDEHVHSGHAKSSSVSSNEYHTEEEILSGSDVLLDMDLGDSSSSSELDREALNEETEIPDADHYIMQSLARLDDMTDDIEAIPARVPNNEHEFHHEDLDIMDIDNIIHHDQHESSLDEAIYDPDGILPHTSDDDDRLVDDLSDRVGQMKRGFVAVHSDTSDTQSSGETDSGETSEESEDELFDYGFRSKMAREEVLSVAIHDLKLTHRLSRAAATDATTLIRSFADVDDHEAACCDYRTTNKWIERKTGVKTVRYDCCRNSCMSFAMYPEKEACDYCELPRWKGENTSTSRIPFTTYDYIPITHRLRLWYADPSRSTVMESYRRQAELEDRLTDYWTSELYLGLKSKGLFRTKTDLAFLLTTDGVQIFKARARFSIWPIALECFNLPPAVRAKRQNMLCVGFIPGPKGPKNLDSFLFPLVKEFQVLQSGITTLNGAIPASLPIFERQFILRGHICLIGADMVAREKIMKVTGNRSYCYCEYCLVRGIWNRGLYCPMSPPIDAPIAAQKRKGSGYPWASWDREDLPMRHDKEFRHVAAQVARKGATEKQGSKYGVKGLSILSRLSSIDFPRSFPPDCMHLWFENVVPDLVKHWRGKYRISVDQAPDAAAGAREGDGSEADLDGETSSQNTGEPPAKRRKVRLS